MSKINQWKEQYREIMEAFLELRDEFEGSEMVFDNMIGQIHMSTSLDYCKVDESEKLSWAMTRASDEGAEFIFEVDGDTLLHVHSDSELINESFKVLFKEGDELILTSYDTETTLLDGTCEAIEIVHMTPTDSSETYYIPYSYLGDLIQ